MNGDFPSDYLARIDALVAEHGWAVQGVGGLVDRPAFAYSVGLAGLAWGTEVMVVGLAFPKVASVLNSVGGLLRLDAQPDLGERFYGVLDDLPVRFDECDPGPFNVARAWWGEHRPFRTVQMFYPDAHGVLPGEAGCDPDYVAGQVASW